jgi:hypothetical protein
MNIGSIELRSPVSIPIAAQNSITRSCALSFVVGFAMVYSRRQLLTNAAIAVSRVGTNGCSERIPIGNQTEMRFTLTEPLHGVGWQPHRSEGK